MGPTIRVLGVETADIMMGAGVEPHWITLPEKYFLVVVVVPVMVMMVMLAQEAMVEELFI